MRHKDFSIQYAKGGLVERNVFAMIKRTGVRAIPSFNWTGQDGDEAPTLHGIADRRTPLPDIQTFRDGQFSWLEVKYKSERTPHWKTGGTLCTGICVGHFEYYLEVQRDTGGKVFMLFVHADTEEMVGDALDSFNRYVHHRDYGTTMHRSGMLFWEYACIPRWGSLDAFESPWTQSEPNGLPHFVEGQPKSRAKLLPPVSAPRQTNFFDALEQPRKLGGRGRH